MKRKRRTGWGVSRLDGFTIIEAVIAIAVLGIAAIGALAYQYHGAQQIRVAQCQFAATRVGQLLLEDWKATGADPAYNPANLNIGFVASNKTSFGNGAAVFTGTTTVDGITLEARLSLSNVTVEWVPKAGTGTLEQIKAEMRYATDGSVPTAGDPTVTFTTFVRKG
jgi:Tfp pilus assembly protein PilV